MLYNIYCDESCYLEHDAINAMALGSIWCPITAVKRANARITEIKERHGVPAKAEIKWSKVGPKKKTLYSDIIDYFFDNDELHFRGLIVPDKSMLNHEKFCQTHDEWFHKMYYDLLHILIARHKLFDTYNIYIDKKDTHSAAKYSKLQEVLCNEFFDFDKVLITRIQPINSRDVQIMQIVDILTGALAYRNRKTMPGNKWSQTKVDLVRKISGLSGSSLIQTSPYSNTKFNILYWTPSNKRR